MTYRQLVKNRRSELYGTQGRARRAVVQARIQRYVRPRQMVRYARGETKYFDTSFSQTVSINADWTGSEVPCTNYIQSDGSTVGAYTDSALIPSAVGSGYGQVDGTKYRIKKIRVRGLVTSTIASDQADVLTPDAVRIVLVQDLRPNGAQAQGENVFTDMGTARQAHFSFQAMGAGDAGRFRILKDEQIMLQPGVAGTDGTATLSVVRSGATFSFDYKPKVPIPVLIKGGAATPAIASLSSVNIFMLAHFTAGDARAIISGVTRCYYEE